MRPLATLRRARAHRLVGEPRAAATALLAAGLRRLGDDDLDGAAALLARAHDAARSSALLHTGVHVGEVAVALRRRAQGEPARVDLAPLALAGVSSLVRRAAGVAPDAPAGGGLWQTWEGRPRGGQ